MAQIKTVSQIRTRKRIQPRQFKRGLQPLAEIRFVLFTMHTADYGDRLLQNLNYLVVNLNQTIDILYKTTQ